MKTLLALFLAVGLVACTANSDEHAGEAMENMDHDAMDGGAMDHDAMDGGAMDHDAMGGEAMDHDGMDHDAMDADGAMAESAAAAADAFRAAIVANDSTAAASMILEDALIVEGGGIETREHYLSGHFNGDGAFLSAMSREPLERTVSVAGHAAWITSTSRLQGNYRDRDVDMTSAELLVLKHSDAGWKVAAVHWSSRQN